MSVALLETGPQVSSCFSDRRKRRQACLDEVQRMGTVEAQGRIYTRGEFFLELDTATQSALAGLFCHVEQHGYGQVLNQGVVPSHIASEGFALMTTEFRTVGGVQVFLTKHEIPDSIGMRSIYNGGFGRYARCSKISNAKESVKFLTFLPDRYHYQSSDDLQAHYLHGSRIVRELAAVVGIRFLDSMLNYTIHE